MIPRVAKKIVKKAFNMFGYTTIARVPSDTRMPPPPEFEEIYEKCRMYTMTSRAKMFILYKTVLYILDAGIPGDFVECGVWKGGSMMLVAYTLLARGKDDRKIYLYDTFEGLPMPSKEDYVLKNNKSAFKKWQEKQKRDHNEWCFSPLEEVEENMHSTGYPKDKLIFVKGKVEETIPQTIPREISILRLDTDWYESTKHELIHLYPLLAMHGVVILDDYGYWAGTTKATDEYIREKSIPLFLIDSYGRATLGIKIK